MARRAASGSRATIASRITRCSDQRGVPGVRISNNAQFLRVGIEALVETVRHDANQHGVVQASGDRDMECAVMTIEASAGICTVAIAGQRTRSMRRYLQT